MIYSKNKIRIIILLLAIGVIFLGDNVNASEIDTKIEIDYPFSNQNAKGVLNYQGWVMSEDKDATIEVYIDGIKQDSVERYEREDVLKAISGYGGRGTNKIPGFRGNSDVSGLTGNNHIFEVKAISKIGEVLDTKTSKFNVKDYIGKLYIDYPSNNQKVKTKLDYQGWVMSDDKNAIVEVYVDGVKQSNPKRYQREDVLKAISGYGGRTTNLTPGYQGSIDISGLTVGTHELKIKLVSSSNKTISEDTRAFNVKKYDTKIEIDSPTKNVGNVLNIIGWEMSDSSDSYIKTYLDDKEITTNISRVVREDVLEYYEKQFGGRETNEKPGFVQQVDISNLEEGTHKLKIELYSKNDVKMEEVTKNIIYYKTILFLGDSLTENYNLSSYFNRPSIINSGIGGNKTTDILNNLESRVYQYNPSKVVLLIGVNDIIFGTDVPTIIENIKKIIEEIQTHLPNTEIYLESLYPINAELPTSYWFLQKDFNTSVNKINSALEEYAISSGLPYLNIHPFLTDKVGNLLENYTEEGLHVNGQGYEVITKIINRKLFNLYESKIEIDSPYSKKKENGILSFDGWMMSDDKDASINFYIDNDKVVPLTLERYEREDVLKVIAGYGGKILNPKPGYHGSIDISFLDEGVHSYKVEVVSKTGEVLTSAYSSFKITPYEGKIEIDKPTSSERVKSKLTYQGWVMSEDKDATVEVYIDGVAQSNIERYEREDVLKAISGYGGRSTNKKPGYRGSVDVSGLLDGVHTMTVKLVSKTGDVIKETNSKFHIKKYDTKIEIDVPSYSNQKANGTLNFYGWMMSEDKDATINFYIDNSKVTPSKMERYERTDVLKAISGYGGKSLNPKPGYQGSVDISSLNDGVHSFRVEAVSKTGEVLTNAYSSFKINAYEGKIEIDKPTSNERVKSTLNYQGWVMSEDKDDVVEVYIDGVAQNNVERYEREDVLKAIKGYGGRSTNKKPGFRGSVDISSLNDGVHVLTVRLVSSSGTIIKEATSSVKVKKYDTKVEIDSPLPNSIKKKTIDIQGWVMSDDPNGVIELYMDDVKIDSSKIERYEREDVLKAIKGYGGRNLNPKPGYRATIDSSNMEDGIHVFALKFISNGNISTYSSKFKIKKYDGIITFDSPRLNHFTSSINIKGWEMSELDNSYVQVYLDGKDMDIELDRVERQDVLDFYKNQYGGKENNSTPGFEGKIDTENISEGRHTLEFRVYSKLDEVITSYKNNICIKSCTPTYYNQTDARWADVVYGLSSMRKTGCSPTSMAMAFSTILGKEILPTDVANYLYYYTNQFNRNMKGTSGLGILYASDKFRVKATPLTTKTMLTNALSSGKIVYAAMGNGKFATPFYNHAIILHGYNGGNTKAYDPLNTSNNTYVFIEQIWNEQSKDYDDYQGGSNFYSLEGYY